jgi:hypothetical protein
MHEPSVTNRGHAPTGWFKRELAAQVIDRVRLENFLIQCSEQSDPSTDELKFAPHRSFL